MMASIYTLVSVLIVSLISLIGIVTISLKKETLSEILLFLVSLSAGVLLGDAFIHILPDSIATSGFSLVVSLSVLSGIIIFFILEKIILWRHCHIPTSEDHPHPFAYMNLVGDGLHNFIDGMVIAGSFIASPEIGIATSIAVIAHEIPQEVGDFGVLVHGGFSMGKALFLNFLTALTAFAGAITILLLSLKIDAITQFLLPFTAGGFIYIAGSDLIPELNKKHSSIANSVLQLISLVIGIFIMVLLLKFHV